MPLTVQDFDFQLPEKAIALYPSAPRRNAKLLHVKQAETARFADYHVYDLPSLLDERDMLVVNNSRVIPAQLSALRSRVSEDGQNTNTAKIGLTLHKPVEGLRWCAFAKPFKRLKVGDQLTIGERLKAHVVQLNDDGEIELLFDEAGDTLAASIAREGSVPLPPYIASKRAIETDDESRYQTLFAQHDGSVAAPTAGLHFDDELIKALDRRGIARTELTLHVGAGTFRSVLDHQDLSTFVMHSERGVIDEAAAEKINDHKARGGRIVAVGTTSLRLLESAADKRGFVSPYHDETNIFIRPGYRFRTVDRLLTNFHLPKSTLLMLVSAFAGTQTIKDAYNYAIDQNYRFYSFGDTSLLERQSRDET